MSLKHGFVSQKLSGADTSKLRAKNWGSIETDYLTEPTHVFDGGSLGALLTRDTGAADGSSWTTVANLTGIPETAIADGTLLARLAANETVSGAWTFSNPIIGVTGTAAANAFQFAGFPGYGMYISSGTTLAHNSGSALTTRTDGVYIGSVADTGLTRAATGIMNVDSVFQFPERSDPAAPSSNNAVLYARDNGSGKTELVVRFPTGAIQIIKTEP